METLENVELFHEDFPDVNQVVVNTELGAFGDNKVLAFIRTQWDEDVDNFSLNKGKQLYVECGINDRNVDLSVICFVLNIWN